MKITPTGCEGLGQLLSEEHGLVERLMAILHGEHEAMVARAPELLEQLTDSKQQILHDLEQNQQRRLGLLHASGLTSDKAGFDALLELCAEAGHDHRRAWEQLITDLQSCQKQNEVNGKVLEGGRRAIHNTLAILLGGQGEGAELYTQEGKSTPSKLGGHTIVKA